MTFMVNLSIYFNRTIAQKHYDNPGILALPEENDLPYDPQSIHRSDKVKRAFT